ncbi:MAG: carboxylesterase family protein [Opitutaceae bacterium]|nr:carboxylesterase family protein [Opitutaceae bacterium]
MNTIGRRDFIRSIATMGAAVLPAGRAIGAAHAADIAFTFGQPKGTPFPVDWTPEAKALSERMRDSFIAFAKTGSPQTSALPQWPRHDPDGLHYLRFDVKPSVARDIIGTERRFAWKSVPVNAV